MSRTATRLITLIMLLQREPNQRAADLAEYGRAYWHQMESHPDGTVTVAFSTDTLETAAGIVLSYGALVDVLAPVALRQMTRRWALEIAEKYVEEKTGAK